jgi:hypothetical protein
MSDRRVESLIYDKVYICWLKCDFSKLDAQLESERQNARLESSVRVLVAVQQGAKVEAEAAAVVLLTCQSD